MIKNKKIPGLKNIVLNYFLILNIQFESSLQGNKAQMIIRTIQDGAVLFNPLTDNILRTYHSRPQIVIKINNEPAHCAGNCDFEWKEDLTPFINNIDISNNNKLSFLVLLKIFYFKYLIILR